jgi:hypothetical protein
MLTSVFTLGGTVKTRLIASLAVGALVVLGTTGCTFLTPQETTNQSMDKDYAPSGGVNVPASSGPLAVRNVLVVADSSGANGNLVATVVNPTDSGEVLNVTVGDGSSAVKTAILVSAGSTLSLGTGSTAPLPISPLDSAPGSTVSIYFQSGTGEGARVETPVLTGQLSYLSTLVPTPAPTPSASN